MTNRVALLMIDLVNYMRVLPGREPVLTVHVLRLTVCRSQPGNGRVKAPDKHGGFHASGVFVDYGLLTAAGFIPVESKNQFAAAC